MLLFAKNLSLLVELSLLRTVQDDRVLFRDLLYLFQRNEEIFHLIRVLREMLFLATYCIICRGTEDALLKSQRRAHVCVHVSCQPVLCGCAGGRGKWCYLLEY